MVRPPIFRGKVIASKIVLDNRDRFKEYLASFEGKRVELVLRERAVGRSDQQNRYYHKIVVEYVSERTGFTHDEAHEELKKQFHVESTTTLKTKEFEELMENIRRWAMVFFDPPLFIPEPNQVDY